MKHNLTAELMERRGGAIQEVRRAAEKLSCASEWLRKEIDDLEAALNAVVATECELNGIARIRERLENIRRARNGMECFQLKCLIAEFLDAAWKEMP